MLPLLTEAKYSALTESDALAESSGQQIRLLYERGESGKLAINVRLARIMGERHLHISDVHRITGIGRATLTRLWYDRAKAIELETLDKLCKALKCRPEDILDYTPE